jgi:hypothetical protein
MVMRDVSKNGRVSGGQTNVEMNLDTSRQACPRQR